VLELREARQWITALAIELLHARLRLALPAEASERLRRSVLGASQARIERGGALEKLQRLLGAPLPQDRLAEEIDHVGVARILLGRLAQQRLRILRRLAAKRDQPERVDDRRIAGPLGVQRTQPLRGGVLVARSLAIEQRQREVEARLVPARIALGEVGED